MDPDRSAPRPGEVALPIDPGTAADATLAFIGVIRTPWRPGDCPRNLRAARATGQTAQVEIAAPYRPGLAGLAPGMVVVLLYWLGAGRRDLIVQAPRHREGTAGVFALRTPVRPNPIGVATVRLRSLDPRTGRLEIDALDAFDGTPLIDLKPWIAAVDGPPPED